MSQDFADRRVVVTGAAGGLGVATVAAFLNQGATVTAIDVNDFDPIAVFGKSGAAVQVVVADVSDEKAVKHAVAETGRRGSVTDLVNIAGIGSTTAAIDTPVEVWDRVLSVNARGTFLMSKHILPTMIEHGVGSIVNVASIAGLVGLKDRVAYAASKGAIIAMTRAMAADHGADGIRINCVCPGTIDTPWLGRIAEKGPEWLDGVVARQIIGRLGKAEEIAQTVLFLASERAAFATGSVVTVDGGLTAL